MTTAILALAAFAASGLSGEIRAKVESAGQPAEGAVVYVVDAPGSYEPPKEPAVMDQIDKEFSPRVLPVLLGTAVRFPNKDDIHHQVYSMKVKSFEVPLYKGEEAAPVVMDKEGVLKLGCSIHDWMIGYILVLKNPFFARTGKDGSAVLKGVPEGKVTVQVWSERLKGKPEDTAKTVEVGAKPAALAFSPEMKASRKAKKPAITY